MDMGFKKRERDCHMDFGFEKNNRMFKALNFSQIAVHILSNCLRCFLNWCFVFFGSSRLRTEFRVSVFYYNQETTEVRSDSSFCLCHHFTDYCLILADVSASAGRSLSLSFSFPAAVRSTPSNCSMNQCHSWDQCFMLTDDQSLGQIIDCHWLAAGKCLSKETTSLLNREDWVCSSITCFPLRYKVITDSSSFIFERKTQKILFLLFISQKSTIAPVYIGCVSFVI